MYKHATANRFYRLVWSQVHACWVAVAEYARGPGKGGSRQRALRRMGLLAALTAAGGTALAGAPAPTALPGGAQVVAGQAGIAVSGSQMTVTQGSSQAIINWRQFDIGAQAGVRFDQPSASAVALNRVVGSDPSQIYGRLSSNGSVFLINPNGVLFGASAQVDVGALAVSSLNLADSAFLAGRYDFAGSSSAGAVRNEGSLRAASGGYVALLAPSVLNSGSISAPQGTVALAAGEQISVDLRGDGLIGLRTTRGALKALADNSGVLAADGGHVVLSAAAADALTRSTINNTGIVQARGLVADGGSIRLVGDGEVHAGALDVSSQRGNGGSIAVSGDFVSVDGTLNAGGARGGEIAVSASGNLSVAAAASAAGSAGAGGSIAYRAAQGLVENTSAVTSVDGATDGGSTVLSAGAGLTTSGSHSARGAAGNGGRIDVSGEQVQLFSAVLDASGQSQGGLVRVGGAFQGGTPQADAPDMQRFVTRWGQSAAIANASTLFVNDSSAIDVSARGAAGQGGTAVLWSQDQTTMLGALRATGAASGGAVEISSHLALRSVGLDKVVLGAGGQLLLDPKNLVIGTDPQAWTYQAILGAGRTGGSNVDVGGLEAGDGYGFGVALSADGTQLAVGAPYDAGATNAVASAGAVRLYTFSSGNFTGAALKGTLGSGYTGAGNTNVNLASNAMYGASVALSGDGKTLAVGAPGQGLGAVYEYRYTASGFGGTTGSTVLDAPTATAAGFGTAVALNADGSKLAAGALYDSAGAANGGAVYLFDNSNLAAISRGATLTGSVADGLYGTALAYDGSGDRLAVGAIGENGGKGAVYLYDSSATPSLLRKLSGAASSGSNTYVALQPGEYFGSALAFNAAGTRLAVGAPAAPSSGNTSLGPGAVRVYDFADTAYAAPTLSATLGRGYATPGVDVALNDYDNFGFALALNGAGDRLVVGAPYSDGIGASGTGNVYAFALQNLPAGSVSYGDGTTQVGAGALSAQLAAGVSITLQASNDLTLAAGNPINAGSGAGALTLAAGRSVTLNSAITLGSGDLTVVANASKPTASTGPVDAERDAGNATLTVGAAITTGGDVSLAIADGSGKTNRDSGTLAVNAAISADQIGLKNQGPGSGNVQLGSAGLLSAGGTGTAIEVVANNGVFTNGSQVSTPLGAGLQLTGAGRFLVYAASPLTSTEGVLAAEYGKHYNQAYTGSAPGYAGSGNWFLYSLAPTLTVTASSGSKVYDGQATATLGYTASGWIDGDGAAALSGALALVNGSKNAGSYAISQGTLSNSLGYTINFVGNGATLTVTPRALAVTASAASKVYDGSTAASVSYASDALAGDTVHVGGTANFADKNVQTGKTVSISGISLSGADAANYALATTTATASADITPRTLTATASSAGKVYDGTTAASVTLGDNRVAGDQLTLSAASAAYADKNAGVGKTINVDGVTLSGTDAGNYTLASSSVATQATIAQKALAVSASAGSKVYDGSVAASVTLTDDHLNGDDLHVAAASSSYDNKNVGSGKTVTASGLTLTGADAGNYALASTTAATTAGITQRTLNASAAGATKVYDGTTAASVTWNDDRIAGDAITYSAAASYADKNAGTGKAVSIGGVTLGGADAGNYVLGTASTATTGIITPRGLTVAVGNASKVYDGTTAASATFADNRIAGDVLTVSGVASYDSKNAGNRTVNVGSVQLSGADAVNYVLAGTTAGTGVITPKALTISATGVNKVYDGTVNASVAYADDRVAGDMLSYSASASYADKQVGNAKAISVTGITLGGADAQNYTLSATTATTAASITARTLTAVANGVSKVYDGTTAASVTLGDDRIAGDQLTLSAGGSAAYADKNAGTGKAVSVGGVTLSGADAANYVLASTTATGTGAITPKTLTVSATGSDKVYDGSTLASVTYSDSGRIGSDALAISGNASYADKNVGAGKIITISGITLTGADAGNYAVSATPLTASGSITARALNVGVTSAGKVYDGSTGATVAFSDNRIGGDVLTVSSASASYADKNAGTGKTVSVGGITLAGADAQNYVLSSTSATTTASITPRALVVTGTGVSKVYDGTTDAAVTFSDNRLAGDQLSVAASGARYVDKNVGANKAITIAGATLTGADAGNYTVDLGSSGGSGAITARTLDVTATGGTKVYDGTTSANLTWGDNRVAGDVLTFSSNASFADKNVGSAKPVSVSSVALGGADAGNYVVALHTSSTTADITPRTLTVTADAASKVYDGTTAAVVSFSDDRVHGDALTVGGGSGAFVDKNAGTGKAVVADGITLAGNDAGNYVLASTTAHGTGTITPRTLSYTVAGVDKVYDGSAAASLKFSDDRLAGDSFSYVPNASFSDKNVGSGKAVTMTGLALSGADARNYQLGSTSATATAAITPRTLDVIATGGDKIYDGTTAAVVQFADNRVSGDALSISGNASFASKNAGVQQLLVDGVTVSGTDAGNYRVSAAAGGTATITPRALNASVTASDKVYDGTVAANVTLGVSALAGDVVQISGSGAFADKNAGTNKAVQLSGVTLSGADAGNYTLDTTSLHASASITPRTLVAQVTASDKVYDGTLAAQFAVTDNRVAGDLLTVGGGSALFADKNAGSGKTVTVSGLSLSGADAGNYMLASPSASAIAAITPKTLTITADNQSRAAGTANPAFSYTVNGLVTGDAVGIVAGSTTADTQSPAGTYPITLAGADLPNYRISYVDGVLTVLAPVAPIGGVIASIVRPEVPVAPVDAGGFAVPSAPVLPQQQAGSARASGATPGSNRVFNNGGVPLPLVTAGGGNSAADPSGYERATVASLPGGTLVVARNGGLRTEE